MKKKLHAKNKAFISTLLIVIGIFMACGKSDKEDIATDLGGNVTSDFATKSDAEQEEIPESLSYTIEAGGNGAVKVEATVYSEGYGQVSIYKLNKREKNAEWVKSYAEKLFDNGKYINVKPYEFCSMGELEDEKQFWEERLMALDEGSVGYKRVQSEIGYIEDAMEHFSESNDVKYPEDQLVFSKSGSGYLEDNSTYYYYESYEKALLRGEVDGNVWLLNYDYGVYEYEYGGRMIFPPVLYGYCVENMDYISSQYEMEDGIYANKCDREEAESEAAKLLDRLGFNNMECVKMTKLKTSHAATYCDGYGIIYAPSLNGTKMFSVTANGASAVGENIAVQPYVSVLVNSEGAYSFCILEDYDIEEKLTENAQMISFQQIDDIARAEFKKIMNEYPNRDYDITKVKFEYLCVTYDGISYVMLPVWSYYAEWFSGDLVPVLIVNALDGAVISSELIFTSWEYYGIMTGLP